MKRKSYWYQEGEPPKATAPLIIHRETERQRRVKAWFERIRAQVAATPSFLERSK